MPRSSTLLALSVLCALASSGCWVRVRSTSYVATTPTGGGEIHALCVIRPGDVGGCPPPAAVATASVDASATVTASASASASLETSGATAAAAAGASGVGATDALYSADSGLGWSASGGWVLASPPIASVGAGIDVTGGGGLSIDGLVIPDRRGGVDVATGAGVRLSALATVGVTIEDCACSLDGEIAALSRLSPFGAIDLGRGRLGLGDGSVSIDLAPAHAALGPSGGATSIAVVVRGGDAPAVPPPVRIHLVIDASTSMRSRWPEVKDAALTLVDRLRPEDELQIVVYGDGASVALAPTRVGSGAAAREIIRGLHCGGRTNIEAGLRAAYDAAAVSGSIVILLSDGVPLGGAATPAELGQLAADARGAHGVTTFAIGLGSEFHPGILHALATEGGGDFRIAPRTADVEAIFALAIAANASIVARDLTVDLELGAGVTIDASAALDAGISVSGGRVHLAVPQVSAESEHVLVVPLAVAGGTTNVASATASWTTSARSTESGSLRIAAGAETIPAGGMAVALDVDLGHVLTEAATLVEYGDAAGARALLDGHAARVEATLAVHAEAALRERAVAARAFGLELEALVPAASFLERRQTASAMLEWSLGFSN